MAATAGKPRRNPTQEELSPLAIEEWIAPKELAAHFGLQEDSAYRWIDAGIVPERFLRYSGMRRYRIHPAVIALLEKRFADAHN